METKRFTFTQEKLLSILKGAVIAMVGALLTYLTKVISGEDFQEFTPLIMAGWSIVANVVKKYIEEK